MIQKLGQKENETKKDKDKEKVKEKEKDNLFCQRSFFDDENIFEKIRSDENKSQKEVKNEEGKTDDTVKINDEKLRNQNNYKEEIIYSIQFKKAEILLKKMNWIYLILFIIE